MEKEIEQKKTEEAYANLFEKKANGIHSHEDGLSIVRIYFNNKPKSVFIQISEMKEKAENTQAVCLNMKEEIISQREYMAEKNFQLEKLQREVEKL